MVTDFYEVERGHPFQAYLTWGIIIRSHFIFKTLDNPRKFNLKRLYQCT